MITTAIIGILASIAIVYLADAKDKAKDARVKLEIDGIKKVLDNYYAGHNGYPNPNSDSSPNLYCIGATDCMLAGVAVNTEFPESIAKNTSNLASIFPTYTQNISYIDTNGNENKGYIYVSCGNGQPVCGNNEATLLYPTKTAMRALSVGDFAEIPCDISSCATDYHRQDAYPYCFQGDTSESCGYGDGWCGDGYYYCASTAYTYFNSGYGSSVSGNGPSGSGIYYNQGQCHDDPTDCNDPCGDGVDQSSCNPYPESSYPYCTSASDTGNFNYDSSGRGWCNGSGYNYYSNTVPSNYPYLNGTGSNIYVMGSNTYGGTSGNYYNGPGSSYTEYSYPYCSSSYVPDYTYSSDGWCGGAYYGTGVSSSYPYLNGTGSSVYITVSSTYGNGNQTGNYFNNPPSQFNESSYPYCSSTSESGYTQDYTGTGWCAQYGYNYYGNSTPPNYPYLNGTGSSIYIIVSMNYGTSGNYYQYPNSGSCQGIPSCNYSSWDCTNHSGCAMQYTYSDYCYGTYNISTYHNCSDYDINSCPTGNGCTTDYDSNTCNGGSFYTSDSGDCSSFSPYDGTCSSYLSYGCNIGQSQTGETCYNNGASCSSYSQDQCSNVSGCSWY